MKAIRDFSVKRDLFQGAKRLGRALLALAAAAMLWIGYVQWLMASLPDTMPRPKEAGIVLGAALWQTTPSPALKERLNRAVQLYQAGMIRHIIVTGGYDSPNSKLTEAEGMRDYLLEQGVPVAAILLENEARSTYQNLLFSRRLMQQEGWSSAVIITHRYHAVRALDIARYLGYDHPAASPMDSTVLVMSWHKGRETLAYTKWQWDKIMLLFGIEPQG
ncbi:YdcF family protein [Paenibacillus sp. P26]|nr:YdcF family protein [Paenibacillus sp. P26]UUZ94591.1 YdcF family protein [Paenibacillus sp. P25]